MRCNLFTWLTLLTLISCTGPLESEKEGQSFEATRPAEWAQPVTLPGVPNLYRVANNLYRSAQPTAEGMAALANYGIRTVINLRSFNSDDEEIDGTGLNGVAIPMKAWYPSEKSVIRFFEVLLDESNGPVLVHCQHGADRTGTICALYRVAMDGWSRAKAIDEMVRGGYGYHSIWANLISFIEEIDIEGVKVQVGIGGVDEGSHQSGRITQND